jgi:hypothetical protein
MSSALAAPSTGAAPMRTSTASSRIPATPAREARGMTRMASSQATSGRVGYPCDARPSGWVMAVDGGWAGAGGSAGFGRCSSSTFSSRAGLPARG